MPFSFIEDETLRTKTEEAHKASIKTITDGVAVQIEEAVGPLKAKNEELIGEKRKIQETLKNFENIDPKLAREALDFLEGNEEAQMIKDGKFEDVIAKRVSGIQSDHEAILTDLNVKLTDAEAAGAMNKGLYQTKMIEDSLRAASMLAKVRPEAQTDVVLRGNAVFSLADDGSVEARTPDGKLVKNEDGKVLTPALWIESLKKASPHYWPSSEGTDAHGDGGSSSSLEEAMQRASDKGDQKEYKRLRDKKNKK